MRVFEHHEHRAAQGQPLELRKKRTEEQALPLQRRHRRKPVL